MSYFFERLREERTKLGLKQADFAEQIGVTKLSQSNYETGKRKPDVEYLEKAASLGADTHYIVTGQRSSIDEQALADCIEILEEVISETGRQFSPVQKAKIVAVLYEEYIDDAEGITVEKINRHLRLVS